MIQHDIIFGYGDIAFGISTGKCTPKDGEPFEFPFIALGQIQEGEIGRDLVPPFSLDDDRVICGKTRIIFHNKKSFDTFKACVDACEKEFSTLPLAVENTSPDEKTGD